MGGTVDIPFHVDGIILKPTLTLDGEPLLVDGKPTFANPIAGNRTGETEKGNRKGQEQGPVRVLACTLPVFAVPSTLFPLIL